MIADVLKYIYKSPRLSSTCSILGAIVTKPASWLGCFSRRGSKAKVKVGFSGYSVVKNLPAVQKSWVWFLSPEDPLKEETATHSSILARKIPGTEEPGGVGKATVWGHDWAPHTQGTTRAVLPLKPVGESVLASFHLLVAPGVLWVTAAELSPRAGLHAAAISLCVYASVFTWSPPCALIFLSKDTSYFGLGPTLMWCDLVLT